MKWVCSKHAADTATCNSGYYSEERIYDGIITMINKLRFCEEDILGQTIQKLELAAAAYKRNNRAASQLSQSIDGGLILSGLPEGWAEAKFIDPARVEKQHDAVVSRMEGNAREGSRNRHL